MRYLPISPPVSVSSVLLCLLSRQTPVPAEKVRVKIKVKCLLLVTGPKATELEDKIAVNVAKFLVPLPPQDAPSPAVTAVTVQHPARVVATALHAQIARSVPIVGSAAQPSSLTDLIEAQHAVAPLTVAPLTVVIAS